MVHIITPRTRAGSGSIFSFSGRFFHLTLDKKNTLCDKNKKAKIEDKYINKVRFEIWLQTNRCTLKILVMDTDEFLNDFGKRLLKSKTHYFTSKKQLSLFKNLKQNLLVKVIRILTHRLDFRMWRNSHSKYTNIVFGWR